MTAEQGLAMLFSGGGGEQKNVTYNYTSITRPDWNKGSRSYKLQHIRYYDTEEEAKKSIKVVDVTGGHIIEEGYGYAEVEGSDSVDRYHLYYQLIVENVNTPTEIVTGIKDLQTGEVLRVLLK